MVVPNDAEKLAIDGGTPRRRVCASMFSGMLAALERLVKAKVSTGQTLRKKRSGLTPVAAQWLVQRGGLAWVGGYLAVLSTLSLAALLLMREGRARPATLRAV